MSELFSLRKIFWWHDQSLAFLSSTISMFCKHMPHVHCATRSRSKVRLTTERRSWVKQIIPDFKKTKNLFTLNSKCLMFSGSNNTRQLLYNLNWLYKIVSHFQGYWSLTTAIYMNLNRVRLEWVVWCAHLLLTTICEIAEPEKLREWLFYSLNRYYVSMCQIPVFQIYIAIYHRREKNCNNRY